MRRLLAAPPADLSALVELGLQHEQQHQELLLTDILHAFAQNPLLPAACPGWRAPAPARGAVRWLDLAAEGGVEIGHDGAGFAFDNEAPRHRVFLRPYRLADRLVRNADWLAFIADGGYRTATLWMADGWAAVQAEGWEAPMHWIARDGGWLQFGLGGAIAARSRRPGAPRELVRGRRLRPLGRRPSAHRGGVGGGEWRSAAAREPSTSVWQWTASAYLPYPGFRPPPGAVGEYNGKFMINQMVLRGGSMATPPGHARPTYRNFFYPDRRWQFTGLRLAQEA